MSVAYCGSWDELEHSSLDPWLADADLKLRPITAQQNNAGQSWGKEASSHLLSASKLHSSMAYRSPVSNSFSSLCSSGVWTEQSTTLSFASITSLSTSVAEPSAPLVSFTADFIWSLVSNRILSNEENFAWHHLDQPFSFDDTVLSSKTYRPSSVRSLRGPWSESRLEKWTDKWTERLEKRIWSRKRNEGSDKAQFMSFVHDVFIQSRPEPAAVMMALLYAQWGMQKPDMTVGLDLLLDQSMKPQYLLIVCLMMSNKMGDDNTFKNSTWADMSGLDRRALAKLEAALFRALDFNATIGETSWTTWLLDNAERQTSLATQNTSLSSKAESQVATSYANAQIFRSLLDESRACKWQLYK